MRAHFVKVSYDRHRWLLAGATLAAIAGTLGTATIIGAAGTAAVSTAKSGANVKQKQKQTVERKEQEQARILADIRNAPAEADRKAKSEIERRKRIRQLSGGKTLLTTETPLGDSGQPTLLGG